MAAISVYLPGENMTPDPDFQKSSPGTWSFNSWLTTAESGGIPGKIICASDQDKGSWDQSLKLKPGDSYVIRARYRTRNLLKKWIGGPWIYLSFPTSKRQPLRIYHELPLSEKWNTVTLPFDAPPGYTNGAVLSAMLAYSKGQIEFSSLEMESVGPFASTPEGTVFSGKAVAACGELKSIYLNQLSVSRANDPVSFREEVKILDEYLENEISNRGPDGFWKKANEDASRLRVAVNLHIFSILYQLPESRYHRAASALEWTTQWTEYLTSHMGPEGRWFLNDPNIDRFILLPLLEAVVYLEPLLTNELRAKTFQTLHRAALFQTQTHNLDGWNFSMAGSYGNMDAYASVIFALARKIFDKKDWVDLGIKTFLTTHERGIRPQGGYDYIAGGNPVPHYQDYVVWNGAKTWLVTGDVRIRDSLAQSREYYPLFTLRTGITDHGVTPPIKHVWGNCGNMVGPEVIAYLTGDGKNRLIQDIRLDLHRRKIATMVATPDALYWNNRARPQELEENLLIQNGSVDGFQSRTDGNWNILVTGRKSPNDTLVSAISLSSNQDLYGSIFEGLVFEVERAFPDFKNPARSNFVTEFVGDMSPVVQKIFIPDQAAILHSSTTLRALGKGEWKYRSIGSWDWDLWHGGHPTPSPWRLRETWILAEGLLLGSALAVCESKAVCRKVSFRLPLRTSDAKLEEFQEGDRRFLKLGNLFVAVDGIRGDLEKKIWTNTQSPGETHLIFTTGGEAKSWDKGSAVGLSLIVGRAGSVPDFLEKIRTVRFRQDGKNISLVEWHGRTGEFYVFANQASEKSDFSNTMPAAGGTRLSGSLEANDIRAFRTHSAPGSPQVYYSSKESP